MLYTLFHEVKRKQVIYVCTLLLTTHTNILHKTVKEDNHSNYKYKMIYEQN